MDSRTGGHLVRGSYHDPKKLILAAAACSENQDDENGNPIQPPPELTLAWQVEQWGGQAVMGGEIPAQTLRRMTVLKNVYTAFQSYRAGKYRLAQWVQANPTQYDIVARVRQMRTDNG